MFVIRNRQVRRLRDGRAAELLGLQVEELLREDHPELIEAWSAPELRRRIEQARLAARRYGVREAAEVVTFVRLTSQLGPRFDQHPLVRAILTSPGFDPRELADRLAEELGPVDVAQILALSREES